MWEDFGQSAVSSNTAANFTLTDHMWCPNTGVIWTYRTKLVGEGFHGTWGSTTKYSRAYYTSC